MNPPLLELKGVEVTYQRSIIGISDVSLSVPAGGITAILGTNGAGKTTTLRAISGFIALDSARVSRGSVWLDGERIDQLAPNEIAGKGVSIVPEREKVFPNLTVAENLLVSQSAGISGTEGLRRTSRVYEMFPRLAQLRTRLAGLLSGGERQMLAIGSALICMPRVLLIDELSLGLAPVIVEDLTQRIIDIRHELSISILLVEQSVRLALEMSDYAYILENGQVALHGHSASLIANPEIQALYLGQARPDSPPQVADFQPATQGVNR